MKIAVICEEKKICDYLPNSVEFYSCNIKCEKIINLCNKINILDTQYNTLLKYLSVPHKIKIVDIKKFNLVKICKSSHNFNIKRKFMWFIIDWIIK